GSGQKCGRIVRCLSGLAGFRQKRYGSLRVSSGRRRQTVPYILCASSGKAAGSAGLYRFSGTEKQDGTVSTRHSILLFLFFYVSIHNVFHAFSNTHTDTEPSPTQNSAQPSVPTVTVPEILPAASAMCFPACCIPIYMRFFPAVLSVSSTAIPESGWSVSPSLVKPTTEGWSKYRFSFP